MECPFCAETIKDEAIVCRHCRRDLRVVRPVIEEIHGTLGDLERLQRELDDIGLHLAFLRAPLTFIARYGSLYVLLPTVLLLAGHYLLTFRFDVSTVYLRLLSVAIPFPFGLTLFVLHRIGVRGALGLGAATAILAVAGMLSVVGLLDHVPIVPQTARDWRETFEYGLSITLAYVAGNFLALFAFRMLPGRIARVGKPGIAAFQVAQLLGRHVGEDTMRRRARRIQELLRTAGPAVGLLSTIGASLYTGLKGVFGG